MITTKSASIPTERNAISLIEVLIVIAILGILFQLLLPAIEMSRESARRAQCQNNLRQIAIGITNYEQTKRALPVGGYGCCFGTWMPLIFPYVEMDNVSAQYIFNDPSYTQEVRYTGPKNLTVTTIHYPLFTCPSDVLTEASKGTTRHNYAVNYGNTGLPQSMQVRFTPPYFVAKYKNAKFLGAPFYVSPKSSEAQEPHAIRLSQITDGLSKTLFASEVVQAHGYGDKRGMIWHSYYAGFMTYRTPNSSNSDILKFAQDCQSRLRGNPPCKAPPKVPDTVPITIGARSRHPGGVNTVMGDSSVRLVDDGIDIEVWRAMSTSQGGEAVGL